MIFKQNLLKSLTTMKCPPSCSVLNIDIIGAHIAVTVVAVDDTSAVVAIVAAAAVVATDEFRMKISAAD